MSAYGLIIPSRGRYTRPTHSFSTEEYVKAHNTMCLIDRLIDGPHGQLKHRYRLHTREATRFEDTLEYDIACPRCSGMLRLCGGPLDYYDQGLYKCDICDKH